MTENEAGTTGYMVNSARVPLTDTSAVAFKGRVLPEFSRITINHPYTVRATLSETGSSAEFSIAFQESQIHIDCTIGGSWDLWGLHRRALDLTQTIIDLICFARGMHLTVLLDTAVQDGIERPMMSSSPDLAEFCTSYSIDNGFDEVLSLVVKEAPFFVALNDLNAALANYHLSPTNFGRVVEAIRVMIAGEDAATPEAWRRMRTALNLDMEYLKLVTDTSAPKRHGNHPRIEADVVSQISERAWRVTDRFIAYRRGGNRDLPESEYPLLQG
jgi:hypothetical protein